MDLEESILDLVSKNSSGLSTKMLQSANLSPDITKLVDAINKLVNADRIQICHKGKELVYVLKDQQSLKGSIGADPEEKLVYQIIEKAGNKGIWIRDLRIDSNIPQTQVSKILKTLESKKLIKSVASVAASKKKVYMLYNIEPDRTVTGGTWYSDQEFETEFVDVLNQQCFRYLSHAKAAADKLADPVAQRNASFRTTRDICDFINGLKVSKVELSIQDIEAILDTLIYDGKIEKSESLCCSSTDMPQNAYRVVKPLVSNCALMRIPCGTCPIHSECRVGGVISPTNCTYMKEWLEF